MEDAKLIMIVKKLAAQTKFASQNLKNQLLPLVNGLTAMIQKNLILNVDAFTIDANGRNKQSIAYPG